MLSPLFWVWLTWWIPFEAETVIHWPDGRTCYYGALERGTSPWRSRVTCRRG